MERLGSGVLISGLFVRGSSGIDGGSRYLDGGGQKGTWWVCRWCFKRMVVWCCLWDVRSVRKWQPYPFDVMLCFLQDRYGSPRQK